MDGWVSQGTQHAALYNIIQDYIAARCEKLAQGFYTAATWPGIEPRIGDILVRRSTSKPPSHLKTGLYLANKLYAFKCTIKRTVYGLSMATPPL